jgi:cell wall assembly regulator SMI1
MSIHYEHSAATQVNIQDQVAALVTKLRSLREKHIQLDRWGADMKLAPPAPWKDIIKLEKTFGFEFPPSYRAFLQLHNGWYKFWPDWSLIGVSGPLTEKMLTDARRTMKSYHNVVHRDGDEKISELMKLECRNRNVIYPPHHPVMATDFNGGVMVFDRNRRHPNGEYEIVELRYASVQYRYQDFIALLKYAGTDTKNDIDEYIAEYGQPSEGGRSSKRSSQVKKSKK